MTNEQVISAWVGRARQSGKNAKGSLYFEGPTIYSYGPHFPIARFVGDQLVMFTTRRYSVTTSRHMSEVRYALANYSNIKIVFTENPMEDPPAEAVNVHTEVTLKERKPK